MIKFGPSGNSDSYSLRAKHTTDVPKLLVEDGLDCFEYSFGRGVLLSEKTASIIGESFDKCGKEISCHAPYFINFATEDEAKLKNTYRYMLETIKATLALNGKRMVFHPGSPQKAERKVAFDRLKGQFTDFISEFYRQDLDGKVMICAETMGKVNQLGSLEEIIELVNVDKNVYPCVDFGHLNARACGRFFSYEDYKSAVDELIDGVGFDKVNNMHVHFSKIEFSKMGEVRHLTFMDDFFGPPYEPLVKLFFDYKLSCYVVCESAGTQSEDVLLMKNYYNSLQQ